ncbi:MAG: FAD-binding protein [Planctomycetia bacterium]
MPSIANASRNLSGWGRHPWINCHTEYAASPSDAATKLHSAGNASVIARGLGRAYGDAAAIEGGTVINATKLDCLQSFDHESGTLRCEAGVSLQQIIDVFLPRGWFLPTTPGTKFVTVGGAIAADIHGKNHHRVGSFGEFVDEFRLLTASGAILRCSRSENPEIFYATIGGMGLTGIILDAAFRLTRVDSAWIEVDYTKTRNLDHTFEAFQAGDQCHEHSVAWVDCVATGDSLGRGVVMQGNHALRGSIPGKAVDHPLQLPKKRAASVPFAPPFSLLNRWSVRAFNNAFYWKHSDGKTIVDLDTFFYPLDSVANWNRLYGRSGFIQYQAFFPRTTSQQGLRELLSRVAASGSASFLAVLKSCGKADGGLLSYLEPGHTLALDLPYHPRHTPALCRDLDEILLRHGGRLYLAKDSMASAQTIRAMYPRLPEFLKIKREIDPAGRFVSSLAKRLGLTTEAEGTL